MAVANQSSCKTRLATTIKIGQSKLTLQIQSQEFRILVRNTARLCAMQAIEQKHRLSRNIPVLQKRYRDAIFCTLALNRAGEDLAESPIFEAYDFEDIDFWSVLEGSWNVSHRRLSPPNKARLRRINTASITCSVQILRDCIEGLEKALAFQKEIRTQEGAAVGLKAHKKLKALIQVPIPWSEADPDLRVGVDGSFFGYSTLHPSVINNALAIGGTGSGKSQSVVLPLLKALLMYELRDGKEASLLVIDPKRELIAHVRSTLAERGESDRLVIIGDSMPVPLFTKDSTLSMSDRLAKLEIFAPTEHASGDHSYWKNLGMSVVRDLLQLEWAFSQNTGGKRLAALMCRELKLSHTESTGFWQYLRAMLAHSRTSKSSLKEVDTLLRSMCLQAHVETQAAQVMQVYAADDELMRQWCYAVQSAEPLINALANTDIARYVDLDPIQTDHSNHTDIPDLIEHGKVVLFCPEPTEGHRVAAMALKQKFFESVFSRADQRRPIGIVIDECQKFITNDSETGEQGFLDRCRAYRCLVVMATQSISSLKHALGSNSAAQTAIEIVTANTPSKFILRTTDVETVVWLKSQLPVASDGDPHVIDVRRPASLKPGEAYFLLANGTWGRRRAHLTSRLQIQ